MTVKFRAAIESGRMASLERTRWSSICVKSTRKIYQSGRPELRVV